MAAAVAVFIGIALVHATLLAPPKQPAANFGLDFIAFYTGGTFVGEGRSDQLFDLRAVREFQHGMARQAGVELGDALGPWWNPPFYAYLFVPLAKLSFGVATAVWIAINLACAATAAWLLVRMLPRSGGGWRTWALVPAGMLLFTPFIHAVTHGQNACTSLLLVTLIVTAWRSDRTVLAGALTGLLFYKPQLAAVLGGVLVVSTGWRAAYGLALTGSALLLVTVSTMPAALYDFFTLMPRNLHFVQVDNLYMWERHGTFKAFWRLLLQGNGLGGFDGLPAFLTALCMAAVAVALLRATPLGRWINPFAPKADPSDPRTRDRLIAATLAATPLLMPFYFDYDLLLLAVPATLFAADRMTRLAGEPSSRVDNWLVVLWPALHAWMLLNADVAERTRVNIAVPMLAGIAGLLIARVTARPAVAEATQPVREPLARAA